MRDATWTFIALLLSLPAAARAGAAPPADVADAPAHPPASARIAPEDEPGEPLVIEGTVYATDGVTPVPGIIVHGYQTDRTGRYRADESFRLPPRLRGWAETDAHGRYLFRTVRPAAYPNHSIPAHVHFHLWGQGFPRQFTDDLQFADDLLLTEAQRAGSRARGRFANVCQVRREEGVWRCTFDLRLRRESNFDR